MRRPGLMAMASFLGELTLAIPLGIVGFEFIRQGRPLLGGLFLVLAAVAVWLPEYVLHRLPSPRAAIRQRLPGAAEPEEEC